MTNEIFLDFQDFVLQVFGPWIQIWLAALFAGSFMTAVLFPFFTLFRLMTRRQ